MPREPSPDPIGDEIEAMLGAGPVKPELAVLITRIAEPGCDPAALGAWAEAELAGIAAPEAGERTSWRKTIRRT
jgi:hypothetical protein